MPRVSEAHRQARRDHILDAATAAFARHGIANTTIARICEEGELSAGAVYGHFTSKEEILHAVYARSLEANRRLSGALEAASDPIAALRAMVAGMVAIIAAPPMRVEHHLSIQVHAAALADADLAKRYRALHRDVVEQVAPVVKALQERGLVRADIDVTHTLWVIIATYQGLRVHAMLDDELDLVGFQAAFTSMVDAAFGWAPQK